LPLLERVRLKLNEACDVYGIDPGLVTVELANFETIGSIAHTVKNGSSFIIRVDEEGLIRYAMLLDEYGVPRPLDAIVTHAVYHEVGHVRDMLHGVYDDKVYGFEPVLQIDITRNLLVTLAGTARDIYMFRRTVKDFGQDFLKRVELYSFMRRSIRDFVAAISARAITSEEVFPILYSLLTQVALDKVVGETESFLGWRSYREIVDLVDEVWKVEGDWVERSKHLSVLAVALLGVDLNALIRQGKLKPFRADEVLESVKKLSQDLSREYAKKLTRFLENVMIQDVKRRAEVTL
jgi:hypothetical protein